MFSDKAKNNSFHQASHPLPLAIAQVVGGCRRQTDTGCLQDQSWFGGRSGGRLKWHTSDWGRIEVDWSSCDRRLRVRVHGKAFGASEAGGGGQEGGGRERDCCAVLC